MSGSAEFDRAAQTLSEALDGVEGAEWRRMVPCEAIGREGTAGAARESILVEVLVRLPGSGLQLAVPWWTPVDEVLASEPEGVALRFKRFLDEPVVREQLILAAAVAAAWPPPRDPREN